MNQFVLNIRVSLLIIFISTVVIAQETDIKINTDWNHQRHSWEAAWITHPTASVFDYAVYNFRKKIILEEVMDSSVIYVSADNRYRLFINEVEVANGPAKGSLQYWRYETIDITPYLKKGENIIAAEVFNLGEFRPVAQFSSRTAFIIQGKGYLGEKLNSGKTKWLVSQNKAYKAIPVTNQMVRYFYVAGPCDSIDAKLYPWGWQQVNFDDSKWLNPKVIEGGVGRGYLHGVFWHLVPRNIPMMEQKITHFKKIARSEGAEIDPGFISGKNSLVIPPNSKVKILLDHTFLTVGYPELIVSGGENSSVKVIYSEALYGEDGRKGNRNAIEGKKIEGYFDVFLPDGGLNRKFTPLWLRTFRYVQLEINTGSDPLEINNYYSVFTVYPFQENASFKTNNLVLDEIWNIGWRTARLCAGETYMDCPYWEQLQYIGDTRIQALISLYVSGDDQLMRNALLQADHSRMPEGLTMGRGPTNVLQVIPPFSLYWVDMVHDFYMHRSDSTFVVQFLPGIQSVLGWFERRMDNNGMLGTLDWFNFSDWTDDFMCGAPAGVDTSNSALISLQFAYALDNASELFRFYGDDYQAQKYNVLATKIKKSVYRLCYNSDKELLQDTPLNSMFSQHTNIWGVLTDAIPEKDQKRVIEIILHDSMLIQTTIYFKFYLFQAMYKVGLANDYLSQLTPWYEMLEKGLTTTEEGDFYERSDCHAWGASPNYDFLATVCGIRPLTPGFKEVEIKPAFGNLKFLKAKMPHPNGTIEVNLEKKGKYGISGSVTLPLNTKGRFIWNDITIEMKSGATQIKLD